MSAKQDRVRARTPTDLERKYKIGKTFSAMMGIANDNRDRVSNMEKEVESGSWKPTLSNEENVVSSYNVQKGWYQRVGSVVTIGWMVEAEIFDNPIILPLEISGVPYIPTYAAYGGGVAHNIYIQDGFAFESWGISDAGVISAMLQPCNNTTDGNLNMSGVSGYPIGGGKVTLAGTICYTT